MSLIQRYLAGLAGGLIVALGLFGLGHSRGYAAAARKYQAVLTQVEAERRISDAIAKAKENGWTARFNELETSLAQQLSASREAQRVSGGRLAGLVQDITRCRIKQLPQVAADPSGTARAARITQRAGEIITAINGVGAAAQRDAVRYGASQDILRAERQ